MAGLSRSFASATLVAAIFVTAGATAGTAADEGMIKYRRSVMKAVGGHMGSVVIIIKGEVPFTDDLNSHTQALAELATIAGKMFPKGSVCGRQRRLLPLVGQI